MSRTFSFNEAEYCKLVLQELHCYSYIVIRQSTYRKKSSALNEHACCAHNQNQKKFVYWFNYTFIKNRRDIKLLSTKKAFRTTFWSTVAILCFSVLNATLLSEYTQCEKKKQLENWKNFYTRSACNASIDRIVAML